MSVYTAAVSSIQMPLQSSQAAGLASSSFETNRAPARSRPIKRIGPHESGVRSHQSSDGNASSNWSDTNLGTWSSVFKHGSNGAHNPCDSPPKPQEARIGIDLWA